MPVELLPCPFCGNKVVLQQNLMGQYGVFCLTLDCVDVGITSFNEEYVVRGWNRRTALADASQEGTKRIAEGYHGTADGEIGYFGRLVEQRRDGKVERIVLPKGWCIARTLPAQGEGE